MLLSRENVHGNVFGAKFAALAHVSGRLHLIPANGKDLELLLTTVTKLVSMVLGTLVIHRFPGFVVGCRAGVRSGTVVRRGTTIGTRTTTE